MPDFMLLVMLLLLSMLFGLSLKHGELIYRYVTFMADHVPMCICLCAILTIA